MQSISEDRGIALLANDDINVLSLGISTAGIAEIRMARQNTNRRIIATTIDKRGLEYTNELVKKHNFENQIELKYEDVCKPFPYKDNYFDYVYSRNCFHYVDNKGMNNVLSEIYRVLKPKHKAFIVVHTPKILETSSDIEYDEETGFTKHTRRDEIRYRRFYTEEELIELAKRYGFKIVSTAIYDELCCRDYKRKKPSEKPVELLEIVLEK